MGAASLTAVASAFVMAVLVGATVFVSRSVVADVGPLRLALLRYAIGAALLLPFALRRRSVIRRDDLLLVTALGIVQFGAVVVLLNASLEHIGSGEAALLFATTPVLSMVFGVLLGREPLRLLRAAGVVLTIAGVAVVVGGQGAAASGSDLLGVLLALGSAASAGLCSVLYRPYLRRYPTTTVSTYAMAASVGALAVAAAVTGTAMLPALDAAGWLDVLFIGCASAVGYYLLLFALARSGATEVMAFLAVSPLTAAGLGIALAGESVPEAFPLAVALVAVGLWLTSAGPGRARART